MENLNKKNQHERLTKSFVKLSKKLYRVKRSENPDAFIKLDRISILRGELGAQLNNYFYMKVEYDIYKTLDHIHVAPQNAIWEDIIKDNICIGIKLLNPVIIPKGSCVCAVSENHPFRTSYMLIFGKYGCYPFLLSKVATIKIKKLKLL